MNEKESEMILCECCENFCPGFNKCMKKEKGEMNVFIYMGKWQNLVEILPVVEGTK